MRRFLVLPLLLAVSACGSSPPSKFFTLDAVPAASAEPPHTSSRTRIQVADVTIPADLDRTSFVTRTSANQINVSDQDRWASPLDGQIRRALSQDLSSRLPPGTVLAPGDPTPPGGVETVSLNVLQFIGTSTGDVTVEADWALIPPKSKAARVRRHESIRLHASDGKAAPITATLSRALGMIADHIAAAI